MQIIPNRRRFLTGLSLLAAAGLARGHNAAAAEAPPETTIARFADAPGICIAPQYVAEELIRAEGFSDFGYVAADPGIAATEMLARGDIDFSVDFATAFVVPIDAGVPIKVISGVHVGCYELFGNEEIRSIKDLKGRRVGVGYNLASDPHIFVSAMATYVGLDPRRDIDWVVGEEKPAELFVEGKVDAFLAFPPEAQDLRARKVGHVILDSARDQPWSQYYCCMLAVNAAYAEKHPAATKRVIRAILKSADICASEPELVARLLVDEGRIERHDYAVQSLREVPYMNWRDYDPEDTVRFFSLRLHEAGIVKSNPNEIIANGTDWRFFNEIKRELKK
ncbi:MULTISPECIES: ABC transporter substrate-binding protein [unclassified Mesorhizobium]|uniref:ABC transporter substrate-binding protein n=1 Tax=unclassified Mesorhizobium TaxID=325217 RepID=UPI0013E333E6|nr:MULTISPECIES: ABC transporter substrate-binding protein [unclassified Mesorhizobium]